MTSTYSLTVFLALATAVSVQAQRADRVPLGSLPPRVCATGVDHAPSSPANSNERGGGTVVWSEDFSNGLAGNNPSGEWTRDGVNGNIWVVNSNAPRGAFTQNAERIASTTFANGFAKFASDSANCTWAGNTPTALPTADFVNWEGSLVSPVIDLSATPFVELVYEQRSRWCCGDSPFFLDISTDGGFTWSTTLLANEGLPINQGAPGTGTTNAVTEVRRFGIASAIAADPSQVRFRFHHDSEAGTSHYYWQIDDIEIRNLPEYEMKMNFAYTSTTGLGEEYGRIPQAQLPDEMNVGAQIYNYGGQTQTGVEVICDVVDAGGTSVFSTTIAVDDMLTGDTALADFFVVLPDLDLGLYTATFTINSDEIGQEEDPSDNTLVRTFEVTEFIYSIDNLGNHPTGIQTAGQTGTGSFEDNTEDVKLLNMYYINAPMTVTGMEIALGSNSDAGGSIIISILDTVDVLSTPSVVNQFLAVSDPYMLTQGDVNAGVVTIPLTEPITLTPNAYYAVASLFADGTNEAYVIDDTTVPQPGLVSALWIPFDPGQNQNFYGGNGTAWAVRLTSNATISVPEARELPGVTMYPNPTNGMLWIATTGTDTFTSEVFNVMGGLVMSSRFMSTTTMDLSELASGVYNVRVSDGERTRVQRITVN